MSAKEQAAIGTLQVVAAAAAPIAPWGTAASVAIAAGIGIYQAVDAADKQKAIIEADMIKEASKIKELEVQKKVIDKAARRPTVPLDLYSGPPMYWIVNSSPLDSDEEFYKIPNSDKSVEWPCGQSGGKSIKPSANPQNIKISDIYAPTPPKNSPSLCVFFWAVPIFFARLMQLIGESMYGGAYDPKSKDGSRTKEEVLHDEVKKILLSGRLDEAGNWFGKIGPVIPPLALSDDEFAPRFYGRSGWVQSLTIDNIRFANGTRFAHTGLAKSPYIQYIKNKENLEKSVVLSRINRRVILTVNPTSASSALRITSIVKPSAAIKSLATTTTINKTDYATMESGWVLTADELLSNYWIDDPAFRKMLETEDPDRGAFYYVTMIENVSKSDSQKYKEFDYDATDFLSGTKGQTPAGIMKTIQLSAGFEKSWRGDQFFSDRFAKQLSSGGISEEFLKSQIDGKFAIAPFDLSVRMTNQEVKTSDGKPLFAPRPVPETDSDSYVFKDIGASVGEETVGISDDKGDYKNRFGWLTEIAIMPSYDASGGHTGWKAVEKTGKYNDYQYLQEEQAFKKITTVIGKGTINGLKIRSSKVYTMLPTMVGVPNQNLDQMPAIYEIIRTRPPAAGETTVKLPAKYAAGPAWANKLIKSGAKSVQFAFRPSSTPTAPNGAKFKLGVIRIQKFKHVTDVNGKKIPYPQLSDFSSALARFSHDENKPVVSVSGKESPSPFYCGRRADERSLPAWKFLRVNTSNFGTKGNDNDTGWEDCHDWSWPYPTNTLKGIGRISKKIYDSLGEGIGRAGCSPSSIATGPTFWGDMNLYGMSYQKLKEVLSTDPSQPGWKANVAVCIWDTISEMQVGAYVRYPSRPVNITQTLAQSVQNRFNIYSNNDSARATYLKTAQEAQKNGNPPRVWDEVKNDWVILTPEQAADVCMDVVDKWFNGVFPRPAPEYADKFKKPNWDLSTLEEMTRAQIMLKNWAIDLGKPESEREGHQFPDKYFSINIFGLDQANRAAAASYNAIEKNRLVDTNPIAASYQMIGNSQQSSNVSDSQETESDEFPVKIALGIAAAGVGVVAAIALSRKK